MIKFLIFDCFGVLYWDDINRIYNLVRPDKFQALNDAIHACDHGYISRQDFLEQVAGLSGISVAAVEAVIDDKQRRNETLIQRVKQLRGEYRIGLLSNMGPDTLDTVFDTAERAELFDDVVISSEVGLIKPSRDLYELALERLGATADETVFIDDRPANVEGAAVVGMKTILFTTNQQFEEEFARVLKTDNNA